MGTSMVITVAVFTGNEGRGRFCSSLEHAELKRVSMEMSIAVNRILLSLFFSCIRKGGFALMYGFLFSLIIKRFIDVVPRLSLLEMC